MDLTDARVNGVSSSNDMTATLEDAPALTSATSRFWSHSGNSVPTGMTFLNAYDMTPVAGASTDTFLASMVSGTYTSSQTAPEPATATLSLLALAGLAARRRRK